MFVALLHTHVVVTPADIQLCEITRALQLVHEIGDEWQWVAILYRHIIKAPIILDRAKGTILLFDKKERASNGRDRRANTTRRKVLIQELVELNLLCTR